MPYEEMLGWFAYYKMRPHGWREDHRTAIAMSVHSDKIKPEKLFPSLAALKKQDDEKSDQIRLAESLKSSGLLAKLQGIAVQNGVEWKVDDKI
jgi:hypothetical protein